MTRVTADGPLSPPAATCANRSDGEARLRIDPIHPTATK